jgi:nitrate/TMAO reductase-like tetraheme cytochrome c subunit
MRCATTFAELKSTIHYTNRSGVRAVCSNCHVPHDWTDKMARKMQASKEVWGKIFGTIDTPEKFQAKRLELAQHEWARFKANDSLECRNCHNYDSMDFTGRACVRRTCTATYLASKEKTCIDCHKGIAHKLPHIPPDRAQRHARPESAGASHTGGASEVVGMAGDGAAAPDRPVSLAVSGLGVCAAAGCCSATSALSWSAGRPWW